MSEPGPHACKNCGHQLVPVAYGFPVGDTIRAAKRGEVVLGGCTVELGQPGWACSKCPPAPLW